MKVWKKYLTLVCCILTCVLLGEFVCFSEAQLQVIIITPPENTTVCRGSDVTISCEYLSITAFPVTWIINGTSLTQEEVMNGSLYHLNNPSSPTTLSLTAFSINGTTTFQCVVLLTLNTITSTRGTVIVISELTPIMITANVDVKVNLTAFKVSWQTTGCTANIIMYNITVMNQYSPAFVTVPANMSSVEISQFPYNRTRVVANREYTITVSAISDQGTNYPSDSVVVNTFILQNCKVTSPSVGTIRVSCDSSHQILVTLTCTNNCDKLSATSSNGYSPFIETGLDPGGVYTVTINVFDGNQVVLNNKRIIKVITVASITSNTSSSSSTTMSPTTTMSSTTTMSKTTIMPTTTTMSTTATTMSTTKTSSSTVTPVTSATTISPATTPSSSLSTSMTTSSELTTSSASLMPTDSDDSDSGGDSGGSSAGGIAGGVIGGIVVVIIIIIIIIVICYFIFYKNKGKESTYDDTMNLKSPPGTGGTHASEADTNVTTDNNAQYDKVVYAAPAQIVNIPHQAAASGEQYAVSTKAVNKTKQKQQQQQQQQHVDAPDTKQDFQGVTYADLQELPSTDSGNRQPSNPHPASAYAELLM